MAKYARWIGGGLGWAVGGPIGAIAGFVLGSLFDNASEIDESKKSGSQQQSQNTQSGDFNMSLIILSAAMMKADGKVMRSELNYVRDFFTKQFGENNAVDMLQALRKVLEHDVSVRQVCLQIRSNMTHPMRLQLLHYLFGIAKADAHIADSELHLLNSIASYLGISQKDFESISAMFGKTQSDEDAYKILEIDKSAGDDEVKKAYRRMAKKYHPDKVAALGAEFQDAAKEKFQNVQKAYEQIRKTRNFN
jgi:DnaJ like chaperone protein